MSEEMKQASNFYPELKKFFTEKFGPLGGETTEKYLEGLYDELGHAIYIHQDAVDNPFDAPLKLEELPPLLPLNVVKAMRSLQVEIASVIGGLPESYLESLKKEVA